MKKIVTVILLTIAVMAVAQNTTRKRLKAAAEPAAAPAVVVFDTIVSPDMHLVDINGYDKPLRSRRETFFATNNGKQPVEIMVFTVKYKDTQGRLLHSRQVRVPVEIPAGETRQVSYKSWDEQQSFYYRNSTVPTRAQQATPYDITIGLDTLYTLR
ncbi:MAG: hypothetical protein K2M55_02735 [Muribaculaceae bacterium]|nr:hypothetical protein [Muribaculaceae bacterium]